MSVSAPAKGATLRRSYETSPRIYRVMRWLIRRAMHILYRFRLDVQAAFPASGPVIITVNHLHLLDPFVVAPVIPRQIVTLTAGKWRDNALVRFFFKHAGAIYVNRGEVDRQALRACLDVLSKDGVLAIAPEGTRTKTGGLQQAKAGVAYIAIKADATIVPVVYWGVENLRDWKKLKRPSCQVLIGKPYRLPKAEKRHTTAQLQHLSDLIMLRIGLMLPPEYRGVYTERIAAIEAGENTDLDVLVD